MDIANPVIKYGEIALFLNIPGVGRGQSVANLESVLIVRHRLFGLTALAINIPHALVTCGQGILKPDIFWVSVGISSDGFEAGLIVLERGIPIFFLVMNKP